MEASSRINANRWNRGIINYTSKSNNWEKTKNICSI